MNEEKKSIERSNFKLKLENDVFRSKLEDYKRRSFPGIVLLWSCVLQKYHTVQ